MTQQERTALVSLLRALEYSRRLTDANGNITYECPVCGFDSRPYSGPPHADGCELQNAIHVFEDGLI